MHSNLTVVSNGSRDRAANVCETRRFQRIFIYRRPRRHIQIPSQHHQPLLRTGMLPHIRQLLIPTVNVVRIKRRRENLDSADLDQKEGLQIAN